MDEPIQRTYQDDFDNSNADTDPLIDELTDSPADELGISETEFKNELDKYADDATEPDDDMRETIEDRDEDDTNGASSV